MATHILEADEFRLELLATIFDDDIDNTPVNAFLDIKVKNDTFCGSASMEIDIKELAEFSLALKKVYDTLGGSASFKEPYGNNGELSFTADKKGHITVKGFIQTQTFGDVFRKNELQFETGFDQTYMKPFVDGIVNDYSEYTKRI
ncbi:MAG: hypothetical protein IJU82_05175 [Ruminiclostridium sp.]|nr:hypothetical protein [Ruminiclostridium sp.]